MLMRHAKSDWHSDFESDFDRCLNRCGQRNATSIGNWLNEHDHRPDRIISSPAVRARETAARVASVLNYPDAQIEVVESLYGATLNTAFVHCLAACENHARPLMIAHNPTMDELVNLLANQEPQLTQSGKLMTTAAVAIFSYTGELQPRACELENLVRPREI